MAPRRQGRRQRRSRPRRLCRKAERRRSATAAEAGAKKWLSTTHGRCAHLTALACAGRPARGMHHSALLNVMIAAARKAARALKRDFGELEKLAGLAEGPRQFRHRRRPPRRRNALCRTDARRGRATAFSARKAAAARAPTRPTPGSSIRSTAPPISCTASRNSPSRSHSSAKARWSPAWSTIRPTRTCSSPNAARAPSSTNSASASPAGKRLADAVVACGLPHLGRGDLALIAQGNRRGAGTRRPDLRRFGAAALDLAWVAAGPSRRLLGARHQRPGTWRPELSLCGRPAASSPTATAARTCCHKGHIVAGNETIQKALLAC